MRPLAQNGLVASWRQKRRTLSNGSTGHAISAFWFSPKGAKQEYVDACIWGRMGETRTANIRLAACNPALEAAGEGPEAFVTGGQGDDGDEGEEEAGCGPDVPPLEDDAEFRGIPRKEHLRRGGGLA